MWMVAQALSFDILHATLPNESNYQHLQGIESHWSSSIAFVNALNLTNSQFSGYNSIASTNELIEPNYWDLLFFEWNYYAGIILSSDHMIIHPKILEIKWNYYNQYHAQVRFVLTISSSFRPFKYKCVKLLIISSFDFFGFFWKFLWQNRSTKLLDISGFQKICYKMLQFLFENFNKWSSSIKQIAHKQKHVFNKMR